MIGLSISRHLSFTDLHAIARSNPRLRCILMAMVRDRTVMLRAGDSEARYAQAQVKQCTAGLTKGRQAAPAKRRVLASGASNLLAGGGMIVSPIRGAWGSMQGKPVDTGTARLRRGAPAAQRLSQDSTCCVRPAPHRR